MADRLTIGPSLIGSEAIERPLRQVLERGDHGARGRVYAEREWNADAFGAVILDVTGAGSLA